MELSHKQTVANTILSKGESLYIHLDPRVTGVVVPPWLTHQSQLVLQVGLDMPIPIPDLTVTEWGIKGTLSFSRTPFLCLLPWSAIFAMVGDDGRGMVWQESMPSEVIAEVEREQKRLDQIEAARKTNEDSGVLVLPTDKKAQRVPRALGVSRNRTRPSHLRVVK